MELHPREVFVTDLCQKCRKPPGPFFQQFTEKSKKCKKRPHQQTGGRASRAPNLVFAARRIADQFALID